MKDNTVIVDASVHPNRLVFSDSFNVAVPFIDKHLEEGRADKIAIISEDTSWTYRDLASAVNRSGNQFLAEGFLPGDRLLMVVTDGPGFIAIFFGAIKAGLIPIAANTMLRSSDYQFLIGDCRCKGIIWSNVLSDVMLAALEMSPKRPGIELVLEEFVVSSENANPELAVYPATFNSECFWLYSSGSTGHPKGVVHPHRSMVCTSERFAKRTVGLKEDDTVFSVSKLFHSYGFGNGMTFPLWVGATIILSDQRVSPAMTFEMIERFRPTIFFGVPTLYAQQLHALENSEPDLSSIRLCVSAGEALPSDILHRWREATGTDILDGLGSTENLHIFISNRPDDIRPGTSGKPVDGYQVKLVDEEGNEIEEADTIGTVWVCGESAATLYWNNAEKSAQTMRGEWLNTGDMYYRDPDGYYHNAGRGDDMMKVGGLWCSPFEIENRLVEHKNVLEAAVVAQKDKDGLIKPAAYVVLTNSEEAGEEMESSLVAHCRAGLDHYKYPRWFYFLPDLPKTATGKIQRFRLRQLSEKGESNA
jgi:benzoate-CoA ligase family protein